MEINIPKPNMTDYAKAQFAIEVAFAALIKQAKDMGLPVAPVMGLMYLPAQELTRDFQQAGKAILLALTPKEMHVTGGVEEASETPAPSFPLTDIQTQHSILQQKYSNLEQEYLVLKRVRESLEARLALSTPAPAPLTEE